jgi:uncharacterized membrane protein YbhN (UPF0104 family)
MRNKAQRAAANVLDWERRRMLILFAAGAIALATAMALADLAGYDALVHAVRGLEPEWLIGCFIGQLVAYFGYVLAVRAVARVDDGPRLSLALTTRTVLAGFGVYASAHAAGGFAVDYWALRRSGLARDDAVRRVLALGALEYAVLAPAAMVCAIILLLEPGDRVQDAMTYPWLLVIPGFAAAAWVSSPRRASRLVSDDPGRGFIRRWFAHSVAGICKLRTLATQPHRHGLGLAGVALYWAGDATCLWCAIQLFHARMSIPALVVAYATGYVLTRRSLPAGGAGIVEVLLTFALVWVGMPLAPALLGVVVYRAFNFWLPVVPALAVLPSLKRIGGQFRRAEERVTR